MKKYEILNAVDNLEQRKAKYPPVSRLLRDVYGELIWKPGQDAMDELISCILSQSTTDANRDRGFHALKTHFADWQAVVDAPVDEVIETIRPAGLANQKGPRIQNALRRIQMERGEFNIDFLRDLPLDEAKDWLTSIDGVGPKTAAIVLCFAFGLDAFPVDTHIHRVSKRIGFIPESMNADKAHVVMEAIVPPDAYYSFHLQLIFHGRETCQARTPHCGRCVLQAHCDYYQQVVLKDA
ncbi:MAG: endonuclease III [Anaerolineae bacterium]